jgi:hypothetical protein
MTQNTPKRTAKQGDPRKDRLKAALKSNMGRRKAQARARAEDDLPTDAGPEDKEDTHG